MLKKTRFYSPFMLTKFEWTMFRIAKNNGEKWTVDGFSPQKESRWFRFVRSTIFLYLSHHSPPDDAFFFSRYILFNPRGVQRIFLSKILRRETFSAPFGCRRTHSSPENRRLRKGAPSRFFELMRKVRADSPTATICLRNSAYMIFRFWGIASLGFTSKAKNTPRCFVSTTCVLRVAHHYLECWTVSPLKKKDDGSKPLRRPFWNKTEPQEFVQSFRGSFLLKKRILVRNLSASWKKRFWACKKFSFESQFVQTPLGGGDKGSLGLN